MQFDKKVGTRKRQRRNVIGGESSDKKEGAVQLCRRMDRQGEGLGERNLEKK